MNQNVLPLPSNYPKKHKCSISKDAVTGYTPHLATVSTQKHCLQGCLFVKCYKWHIKFDKSGICPSVTDMVTEGHNLINYN